MLMWSATDDEPHCGIMSTDQTYFGDTSSSAAGPPVWNASPSHLRWNMNYRHFKHALKGNICRLQSTTAHCD